MMAILGYHNLVLGPKDQMSQSHGLKVSDCLPVPAVALQFIDIHQMAPSNAANYVP